MPSAPSASSASSSTEPDVIALAEKTHTPVAIENGICRLSRAFVRVDVHPRSSGTCRA